MVFNSLVFVVFLAVVLGIYFRLGLRGQNRLLIVASYVFYGWWDWRFLGLLVFSTVFDWWAALKIDAADDPRKRKLWLIGSMVVNMGILGFFKYFNFFAETFADVLGFFGFVAHVPTLQVILPLGISFYTFLSMSYTIDVYRKALKPTSRLSDFVLFVSFFPHLVAGPIVRASYLLPQCQKPRVIVRAEVLNGIWLCLMGFVKKVVIADRLGHVADWGFSPGGTPGDANAWLVVYAFAFQIYGDFSGYSDIARGLSKLMGFELPLNFRAPYLVGSPSAFWQHWHISLSTWLRDYLYIPLGGNRGSSWATYRNLMLTMLLGGLWHGAGLAFLIWGLYHGLLLVGHRVWSGLRSATESSRLRQAISVFLFFHLTCIGWLFFRAGTVPTGQSSAVITGFLTAMFSFRLDSGGIDGIAQSVGMLGALALFLQCKCDEMERFSSWPERKQAIAVASALSLIAAVGEFHGGSFIYFQF